MDMSNWWEALSLIQKIYWLSALPSTLVFLVQLILQAIGADADDMDFDSGGDIDLDHGAGFNLLSPKSIISFLMIFGWSGLVALKYGIVSTWIIIVISVSAGLIMMFLTAWVFYLLIKLQQSGTLKMSNAIGKTGEVYLTIPAKKKGNGKIQIVVQSSLRTLDAVTEESEDIKTGTHVEVIEIFGDDTLIVRKKR